jgi:hypothetical protein
LEILPIFLTIYDTGQRRHLNISQPTSALCGRLHGNSVYDLLPKGSFNFIFDPNPSRLWTVAADEDAGCCLEELAADGPDAEEAEGGAVPDLRLLCHCVAFK